MSSYEYMIGVVANTMTNVEAMTTPIPAPKGSFLETLTEINLPNGHTRWAGFPSATWLWGFLRQAQYDELKAFCPGSSSDVYIRTKDNNNKFDNYKAIMHWPVSPEKIAGRYLNIEFKLSDLVYEPQPAPSSLVATAINNGEIDLTWDDNSTYETGFEVHRSLDGVTYVLLATVAKNIEAYADKTVSPLTTYYYMVRAITAAGSSAFSNADSDTTPA